VCHALHASDQVPCATGPCAEVVVLLDGYGQSGYMASIMRPRAGLAGRLGDLAKMALPIRVPHP
jgi:hypothetical protein